MLLRGCLYGRRGGTFAGTDVKRDGMFAGTDVKRDGTFAGTDVKRDLAMRLYFCPVPFTWKNFARSFFVPSRQSGIPVKAGQFLSYKHSVQLCRDDIMLTLQIKSRVKSSRVETFSCKPGVKSVPSRQTSRPTSHINRF